jgi:uncharacterized membrane protein
MDRIKEIDKEIERLKIEKAQIENSFKMQELNKIKKNDYVFLIQPEADTIVIFKVEDKTETTIILDNDNRIPINEYLESDKFLFIKVPNKHKFYDSIDRAFLLTHGWE